MDVGASIGSGTETVGTLFGLTGLRRFCLRNCPQQGQRGLPMRSVR
jgi:hypothetical protein